MTTRRIISNEKTVLGKDGQNDSSSPPAAGEKTDISPAVPTHVIVKLLGFTLAMVVCPIGSYFLTLNAVFRGNSTYAGATAAIVANIVLIGYIVVAMMEDQGDDKGKESKKAL